MLCGFDCYLYLGACEDLYIVEISRRQVTYQLSMAESYVVLVEKESL